MYLTYFKRYWLLLTLFLIILIGVFFRTYQVVDRFDFAHDGDLYSWIVKDIVVNKHFRLIGQLTSSEGIFIGPFFYYLLVPFFLITNMESTGGIILVTIISVLTIVSFYFVFKKLFNETTGLVAALVQAISLTRVAHDRWVVPTNTTSLWEIWYFYCILQLTRGNFFLFPLLGFLIGTIWHINLSETPLLALFPIGLILGRKIPTFKDFSKLLIGFFIPSLPLLLFEFKHNFIQSKSFMSSFLYDQGGGSGVDKLIHVLSEVSFNIYGLFFYPFRGNFPHSLLLGILLLVLGVFLAKKKVFQKKEMIIIFSWPFLIIGFFSISTKIISEYYFSNLDTIFLSIVIVGLAALIKHSKKILFLSLILFSFLIVRNSIYIINSKEFNKMGYPQRKKAVEYIKTDMVRRGYPCIGITYIAKFGDNVGFRYLFYLNDIKIVKSVLDVPVYNLVIPRDLAMKESRITFGNIGLIPPSNPVSKEQLTKICQGENRNLTDPVLGYVE